MEIILPELLDDVALATLLCRVHHISKECFFADDVMPRVMEKMIMPEDYAIELINKFMARGWLVTKGIKEKFFLRPGYIAGFPIIISKEALAVIRCQPN